MGETIDIGVITNDLIEYVNLLNKSDMQISNKDNLIIIRGDIKTIENTVKSFINKYNLLKSDDSPFILLVRSDNSDKIEIEVYDMRRTKKEIIKKHNGIEFGVSYRNVVSEDGSIKANPISYSVNNRIFSCKEFKKANRFYRDLVKNELT